MVEVLAAIVSSARRTGIGIGEGILDIGPSKRLVSAVLAEMESVLDPAAIGSPPPLNNDALPVITMSADALGVGTVLFIEDGVLDTDHVGVTGPDGVVDGESRSRVADANAWGPAVAAHVGEVAQSGGGRLAAVGGGPGGDARRAVLGLAEEPHGLGLEGEAGAALVDETGHFVVGDGGDGESRGEQARTHEEVVDNGGQHVGLLSER